MMMDAVMYGMIPSAKTAKELSAPPEKRLRKPMAPCVCACSCSCATWPRSMPGTGMLAPRPVEGDHPQREQHLVPQVRDLQDVLQVGEHASRSSEDSRDQDWVRSAVGELVALGRRTADAYGRGQGRPRYPLPP
jgi:hypothetical protein